MVPTVPRRRPGRPAEPVERGSMLRAARAAFAEGGFKGTTLESVAARSGVSKQLLVYHFRSKLGLYREVLDAVVGELRALVDGAVAAEGSFEERIDRLGEAVVTYLAGEPGAARLLVREMVDGGPFVEETGQTAITGTLEQVQALLANRVPGAVMSENASLQLALSIVSLHLFPFAAATSVGQATGVDPFSPRAIAARRRAVLAHVRALLA